MKPARRVLALLTVAALAATVGCSSAEGDGDRSAARSTDATTPRTKTAEPENGWTAYAAVVRSAAPVRRTPEDGAEAFLTVPERTENGAPQHLLVLAERSVGEPAAAWYEVLLPVRPNGSTGWVRGDDVDVVGLRYRLVVRLSDFRLDVFDGDRLDRTIVIGTGTDETPTPGGTYALRELLRPPDQEGIYGHYVFGLSGFSEVLVDWPGGGVLGIHGTNDPAAIGTKVSHGCIRMANADIDALAALLPLGTPVTVVA